MTGRLAFLGQAALAGTLVVGESVAWHAGSPFAAAAVLSVVAFLANTLGIWTAALLHEADKALARIDALDAPVPPT